MDMIVSNKGLSPDVVAPPCGTAGGCFKFNQCGCKGTNIICIGIYL